MSFLDDFDCDGLPCKSYSPKKREKGFRNYYTSGSRSGHAKLTEKQVGSIKREYIHGKKGFGYTALAKKYGVTESAIRFIIIGRNWKDVEK